MRAPYLALLLCALLCASCADRAARAERTAHAPVLSRRPVPPASLDGNAMRASYPRAAMREARGGVAFVRMTISAEGNVTVLDVVSEAPRGLGFGDACVALVDGHRTGWRPALDRHGRPTAYTFTFRCDFAAEPATEDMLAESPATPTEQPPQTLPRRPSPPPGLNNAALLPYFPTRARREGVNGEATVRIELSPEGEVRSVTVRDETPEGYGFGDACATTVLEFSTGWSPALDAEGRPGAFTFPFSCRFVVQR
jgi:TonB family protein